MRDDAAVHNHRMNRNIKYIYSHGKRHYDALEQQVTIITAVPSPHPPLARCTLGRNRRDDAGESCA